MTWTLFIDDERNPDWTLTDPEIARTVYEAIELIEFHGTLPSIISFDHDLGKGQPTAMTLMWWIIEAALDDKYDANIIERVIIHSANPVGAENLRGLWNGFAASELHSTVQAELKPRTSN